MFIFLTMHNNYTDSLHYCCNDRQELVKLMNTQYDTLNKHFVNF